MVENIFDVSESVVLVSGASRGIGETIAQAFAERDATVVITGRHQETLDATAEKLDVGKGSVEGIVCDVAEEASINACVDRVIEKYGRIDTLVNSAGVNIRKPATEFTAEDYDFVFNINLRGTFLLSTRVGRQMIAQGSGSQINIDSLSSNAPIHQVVPYSMSKSGVSAMTRGLASEWGPHGVRVNALAPGFILTDLTQKLWSDPNMKAWGKVVTPLQRMGVPVDMIGTALFLASSASAFLTGQVIRVDGGASAGLHWPIADDFQVTGI
ncbi:MAG: SDR family oxidoreductase [Rhodospirillales bacterium]|nr:SDR family oxidoreductase [Rhodospirillales bacterium]